MIGLRPYQQEVVDKARSSIMQGRKRIALVLGCGAGKSVIAGNIARMATEKHNDVMFIVHRKELCEQIRNTFSKCGVDFDYCSINMVQTLARRLSKINKPKLIICDEAHHILSNSYMKILDACPEAIVVGLTATPIRMNEGGLGKVFEQLIEGVSTKWLIENHYLAPYKYYGVTLADTSKLHTKNGDYDKHEVEELMSQHYIFGSAVENWKKYANGEKTIVYCSSINTSKETVQAFKDAGISAEHLDGTTPKAERERVMKLFRDGDIRVLANCDLFGEGLDVPDCSCVVLLRPTKSLSLAIQQQMRCMRYQPGKVGIILDHVGLYRTSGLPDDDRMWSLEGKKKREKTLVTVRECGNCFAVNPANATVCKYCGAELVKPKEEKDKKFIEDVTLQEIKAMPYDDYKKITTFNEMWQFAKAKKYHFMWVLRKCKELSIEIPVKYERMWYRARYY